MPAVVMAVQKGDADFPAKLTTQVILCSIIAAFGGLMFGYDIGISGLYSILQLFIHVILYICRGLDESCISNDICYIDIL